MKPGFQMVPAGPSYSIKYNQSSVNDMYRKSTALLLITLLVASSAAGLGIVSAQPVSTSQQVAETLLNVLGNSHGEVTSLIESVGSGGGTVSDDAQEAYDEAIQLRTQAQEEYDLGEYEEAVKTATKALNMYGKAAGKVFDDEDEPEEDDTEEFLGLFVAHEKSLERLEKLRRIADDLTAQGIDVTEANALIAEVQGKLDAMRSALDAGEFESAEDLLDEANGIMGQSTDSLQGLSSEKKKEKTEEFIVKTKSMILNLETKLGRVLEKYDVTAEDADAIRDQFQEMKDRLDGIDLDAEGDLDDVIDDLKDIVKESRDVGDDEDELDDEVVNNLKEINKQESKLERYRERVEELALLGVDTTGLEALVIGAEEALADALAGTDEGDEDATEELIDDADDLLDDLDDLIDEVEDEAEDLEEEAEDDEEEDESDDDVPGEGESGTGDDDSEDEDEPEDDESDNGNGESGQGFDPESSFDEVMGQVNEMIAAIQSKIDVLGELDQDTVELGEQLSEIKALLEDVEDIDELVEIEEDAWDLLMETMNRLGEDFDREDFDFESDDGDHSDDDHPDDDHPDDDHPDDDDDHPEEEEDHTDDGSA